MVRTPAIAYPITAIISSMVFVCLNIADAWLTTQALAHGGIEAVWWFSSFNGNMFIKGLLAFLVAVVLIHLGKARLLKWLNIAMLFVVLSNGLCFLGYFGSWLYWQNQIATVKEGSPAWEPRLMV